MHCRNCNNCFVLRRNVTIGRFKRKNCVLLVSAHLLKCPALKSFIGVQKYQCVCLLACKAFLKKNLFAFCCAAVAYVCVFLGRFTIQCVTLFFLFIS